MRGEQQIIESATGDDWTAALDEQTGSWGVRTPDGAPSGSIGHNWQRGAHMWRPPAFSRYGVDSLRAIADLVDTAADCDQVSYLEACVDRAEPTVTDAAPPRSVDLTVDLPPGGRARWRAWQDGDDETACADEIAWMWSRLHWGQRLRVDYGSPWEYTPDSRQVIIHCTEAES